MENATGQLHAEQVNCIQEKQPPNHGAIARGIIGICPKGVCVFSFRDSACFVNCLASLQILNIDRAIERSFWLHFKFIAAYILQREERKVSKA